VEWGAVQWRGVESSAVGCSAVESKLLPELMHDFTRFEPEENVV